MARPPQMLRFPVTVHTIRTIVSWVNGGSLIVMSGIST